ncbi:triosephosphate isomerase [Natrialba magadii ATCC 43099]|uniref:Triosephosphate isomerase n=1 Tax=Natrialba magadii (strain ATCC 43099 / DSM 3394 / CCM 3739 / CIP 104546 / IAM 13178 / JCM 8861 / NBRC 102185 / NCIMB 2190 / MS3) TaxID=547559 RepID=D3SSB4_NATMM|nr:triose-phosphate isomerase [Natrialba magadii]ADD04840.1 triosephosphate isomerase [Natrialba magadii ATCC 43099]ELY24425.1 triosephosphate isomerase [Natrialba magadii ATCC 43099]
MSELEYPFFLVNTKTNPEVVGDDLREFAATVERVADDTERRFALAPQVPDIRLVASETTLPIVAQTAVRHEDASIGDATCEAVAAAGADAVFVNHPENEDTFGTVGRLIERCDALGLESIVCVPDHQTAAAALAFDPAPDCLLFEQPADIASEGGMVRSDPEGLESFVEFVAAESSKTRVFVGGGIRTAEDVEQAFDCGVDATGAASAALEAAAGDDFEAWLRAVAAVMPPAGDSNT